MSSIEEQQQRKAFDKGCADLRGSNPVKGRAIPNAGLALVDFNSLIA